MIDHESNFDADSVSEGDYISPRLVARTPTQLGNPINHHDDGPETELLMVTETKRNGDHALLFHEESGLFVRASTTQHRDSWKVHDYGETVTVESGEVERRLDGTDDISDTKYMSEWVDALFNGEIAGGRYEIADGRELAGPSTLHLYGEFEGDEGYAEFSLE